jgi:hypothetical protein
VAVALSVMAWMSLTISLTVLSVEKGGSNGNIYGGSDYAIQGGGR